MAYRPIAQPSRGVALRFPNAEQLRRDARKDVFQVGTARPAETPQEKHLRAGIMKPKAGLNLKVEPVKPHLSNVCVRQCRPDGSRVALKFLREHISDVFRSAINIHPDRSMGFRYVKAPTFSANLRRVLL